MNHTLIAGGMYAQEDILNSFFPYAVIIFLIMLIPIGVYKVKKEVFPHTVLLFTCGYLFYMFFSTIMGSMCPHYEVYAQNFSGGVGAIITLIFYISKTSITEWRTTLFIIVLDFLVILFGSRVPIDLYKIATNTY